MRITSLAIALLFVAGERPAQAAAAERELGERIAAYLEPFDAVGHISGTVLVARGDRVVFERAYGMASHELGVANRVDTRHCIASITKPMTVIIALRLMEAGKLAAGDALGRWIEGFPRGEAITVEHLMRHRAGIPHRVTREIEECVPRDAADMVALAKKAEPVGEPGGDPIYSSAGFSVLARVLEKASGESYAELLAAHVCAPADMQHTVHTDARTVLPGRAQSYLPGARGMRNAPLKDLSFLVGAGSVYSTARDLFRLLRAVRSGAYGRSVNASLMRGGGLRWNGATNGFRAYADFDAATDVSVVVTANLTTGALDRMRVALPKLAAGESVPAPAPPRVVAVPRTAADLRAYRGDFQLRPGRTLTIRVQSGEMMIGTYALIPIGEDRFFSLQDYAEIAIERDDDGRVTAMKWGSMRMPRVGARRRDCGSDCGAAGSGRRRPPVPRDRATRHVTSICIPSLRWPGAVASGDGFR